MDPRFVEHILYVRENETLLAAVVFGAIRALMHIPICFA